MSAMNLSRLFAALGLFLLIGAALAKEEQIETVATGTGDDETAALSDALAKAVAQVLGVQSELNVATGRQNVRGRTVTEEGGATAETRFEVSAGQTANATMRAKGRVARYEVESVETLPDGRVRVTARAWVVKHTPEVYKAPGSAPSKRRVAVLPVSTDRYEYDFFGKVGGNELGDRLTNAIESALISSGSVSVMDRRSLDVALRELGLLGSNFAAPAERAKLRNLRGTDLVVQVTLREAVQEQYTEVFKTTGQTKVHNSVRLEGEIRGIVPATSEVVFNRVVSVYGGASRQAAFDEFAAQVAAEAIAAATGKPPARAPQPTRTVASAEEPPPPPEPEGPRRSGVRLKFDRR